MKKMQNIIKFSMYLTNDVILYNKSLESIPILAFIAKKHLYNICTTSAQRLRRWSNIVQFFLLGYFF